MLLAAPKETAPGERRAAITPDTAKQLVNCGLTVVVEAGAGEYIHAPDADYRAAGAEIDPDRKSLLARANLVIRVGRPPADEIALLQPGCIHISYLDPYSEGALVRQLRDAGTTAISMEMIPRTTRAQKMDALSSQANLAGYVSVLLAARSLDRILPMMMTPAGTLAPARVFVIGAGVAGLQAIATAKRLGARVQAFDTRPVVKEQVASLGAGFLEIDLGETGQTRDGYARQLTEEQLALQQEGQKRALAQSDIVITTAQVFGRPAPRIITRDMLAEMRPGSVVVDMAVESGGNVEGSRLNEEVTADGVTLIGLGNLPSEVCVDASRMYAANLFHLIDEYWNSETKKFQVNLEDDIQQGCVITHDGSIVNESISRIHDGKTADESNSRKLHNN